MLDRDAAACSETIAMPDPPRWRSVDDARQALAEEISRFLAAVAEDGPLEFPTLAIRVTAGTGKTWMLLNLLGGFAAPLLARGHVQIFVPTHDLAEEAFREFREMHPDVPAMVLRGRGALNPDTGGKMCRKADLVEAVGEIFGNVSEALCQTWDPVERRMRKAFCRRSCPWYEQLPDRPTVIFLAHAYLTSGMPVQGDVALRVIDEKFHATLLHENTVSLGNWLPRIDMNAAAPEERGFLRSLDDARGIVARALRIGEPVNESLRGGGVSRANISAFAEYERSVAPRTHVDPMMLESVQRDLVDRFDLWALRAARGRARMWQVIHESWDRPASERLVMEADEAGGGKACRIRAHRRDEINQGIPTILLDADADPLIVETVRPGARFVSVDVAPNADVVQIRDRTFSTASLVSRPKADGLRRDVLSVVEREVARACGGVLLVATREVLRELHRDADPSAPTDSDEALMRPILGAEPRWFGPRLQGVNTYRDFETVILLGRLEPPMEAIDRQLRSFNADGDTPLVFASGLAGSCGWFPGRAGWYLRSDGRFDPATVRHHPDPGGAALLAQTREAHMLQAVARIRAVGSPTRKRIVILCSIPLPDLPVTDLVPWAEFVSGVPCAIAGRLALLKKAIDRPDGPPLIGLRLSVAGAVEDAPHAFPTRNVSGEWRRGMPTEDLRDLVGRYAATDRRAWSFVLLRKGGGGRACPAIVMATAEKAKDVAATLWPGLAVELG